jgi:hypothetical protein
LTAAGGLALLTGAAFTTRTFYLSRREQLSDRYTKAISLLASEKITERLGGVYALEHLMIESERDHQTVVEVLAAFVRERAPIENLGAAPGSDSAAPVPSPPRPRWVPRPAPDVDAALTVLRRRPQRPEHHAINMARTDSAALISQRRISEVQTCMEQGSAWPGSSESSFRGRHWMALS